MKGFTMTKKLIAGAALALVLVVQVQPVFAADYNADFLKAVGKNDFKDMEKILQKRAKNMNLEDCLYSVLKGEISGFNKNNVIQVLSLLVKYGAKLDWVSTDYGLTMYNSAIKGVLLNKENWSKSQLYEIVQYLLSSGANPNGTMGLQGTQSGALWEVTGNEDIFKLLLKNGADIDERVGKEETTLLMSCARDGKLATVKMLVDAGAKVNLRNSNGSTAASLAYDKGEIEVYNYLKEHGAMDFEPKAVQAAPAQPSTTNVYVTPPASSGSSSSSSAPKPAFTVPKTFSVTVYYLEDNVRKTMPYIETAETVEEAEKKAEREWKNLFGYKSNMFFIEAVGR